MIGRNKITGHTASVIPHIGEEIMKCDGGATNRLDGDPTFQAPLNAMNQDAILVPSQHNRTKLVKIRSLSDERGVLSVADSEDDLPFVPRRVYWLHGGTVGTVRGGHAHRKLEQLLVAMSGTYEILVDDGQRRQVVRLETPTDGLLITPVVWREIRQASPAASLAVLASLPFDAADYIHDYAEFLSLCGTKSC